MFGASAIADRRDVIPAALEAVGGRIEHFGMPVDPGNLLLIGNAAGRPVLGAPAAPAAQGERLRLGIDAASRRPAGAARGHHRHGRRRLADGDRHPAAAARRAAASEVRNIAALVLAAGRSSRMGGPNKLLAEIGGRPLVRIVTEQVLASRARPVIVVTGHQREGVEAALADLPVEFVHNAAFADGLGTSLKAGIGALPASRTA